jgi:MFS family permease
VTGPNADTVDFRGESEHHSEPATVVVDARTNEPFAIAANRQVGFPRKDGVEVRTNDDRRQLRAAISPSDDVARVIGVNLRQTAVAQATRDPSAALLLLASRRGDLRHCDLRPNDRFIARGETCVRRSGPLMSGDRVGERRRAKRHAYELLCVGGWTQVVDSTTMAKKQSDTDRDSSSRSLGRNVYALAAVSFFTDVSSEMIYPLLPVFLTTVLGASAGFIGAIEGAAESTAALLKLVSGWWSDRVRRRKPLVVAGYALASAVRPLVAIAQSATQVLLIRVSDRVGKGIRNAPRDALIADSIDPSVRGRAFGVRSAADNAGALLGPLIAFAILSWWHVSLRTVFWLAAIPGVIAVIVAIAGVREVRQRETLGGKAPSLHGGMGARFWAFLVVIFIFTLGNSTDAFLLLRARQLGVPVALAPILWALLNGVKSISNVPGGALSDRIGRRPMLIAGWLVYAIVYFLFARATKVWEAWALFAGYGLFFGLSEGTELALVADVVPADRRGSAYGWYYLAIGIGALPASLVFGVLWDRFGSPVAFSTGAGLALAAAIALFALPAPRER